MQAEIHLLQKAEIHLTLLKCKCTSYTDS